MQPRDLHSAAARPAQRSGVGCWKAAAGLALLGAAIWAFLPRDSSSMPPKSQVQLQFEDAVAQLLGHATSSTSPQSSSSVSTRRCGDGRCEPPETSTSCGADCPAVSTPAQCGEEPHSDPGGYAVVWGASHKVATAAECCQRCSEHAANPRNSKRPCNSWVWCHESPQCWALDTGNWHAFGECWLKWQADPAHPLYGQRGAYSAEFRTKHWRAHLTGKSPDGTRRNLSVPTHVPWTGGIMGARVDRSVTWETGLEGMRSSAGKAVVMRRRMVRVSPSTPPTAHRPLPTASATTTATATAYRHRPCPLPPPTATATATAITATATATATVGRMPRPHGGAAHSALHTLLCTLCSAHSGGGRGRRPQPSRRPQRSLLQR